MSKLRAQIADAYKTAMRERNQAAVNTLRMIQAALKDKDIAARPAGVAAISEDAIRSMLQSMIKQRREAIALYEQGGRSELAAKEADEITLIERFLPRAMTAEETEVAIASAIADLGAASIKDMGKVMNVLKERFAGAMDFQAASAQVKAKLSA